MVFLLVFFGIPTQIPNFVTIYDVRAQFGATQANLPGAGYVVAWAGNVIYPLLMALGLSHSRRLPLFLGIVGELVIYSLVPGPPRGGPRSGLRNRLGRGILGARPRGSIQRC